MNTKTRTPRLLSMLAAASLLALAAPASAQTAHIAPVAFSEDFQTDLEDDYGLREGEYLSERVTRAVSRELEERGVALGEDGYAIEVTLVDARPNKPTFQQLGDRPGLDYARSISTGGAELSAVIRAPDGSVADEVTYRRFSSSLLDAQPIVSPWQDANRSINRFANRVADAYGEAVANAPQGS